MELKDEILAALQAAGEKEGPLLEPRTGRHWQAGLHRALGFPLADMTAYDNGRAYRFEGMVPPEDAEPRWTSHLKVWVSGAGPYATHLFLLRHGQERWWIDTVRTSRVGFTPKDAEVLEKVRGWYAEHRLTEVDVFMQATQVPEDVKGLPDTLGKALFG